MILRGTVLLFAGAAIAAGVVMLVMGTFSPAIVFGGWGLLIVIGTIHERIRYKALLKQAPGSRWVRSTERFLDPQTGAAVTVYVDPHSGERQYVQE